MKAAGAGFAALAALARVASAFLIPGDLATDRQIDPSPLIKASVKHQLVTAPCSDCLFPSKQEQIDYADSGEEPLFSIQGGANSIVLNVTVSEDGRRLEINGESVYPLDFGSEDIFRPSAAFVQQVSTTASIKDIESGLAETTSVEVTGHGFSMEEETAISDMGDILVPIRYIIFDLNHQPVTVDDTVVHILKMASGELFIQAIYTLPTVLPAPMLDEGIFSEPSDVTMDDLPPPPFLEELRVPDHHAGGHKMGSHKECKTLPASICKLKKMIETKVHGMKKGGCRGKMGMHTRPQSEKPGHIKPHFLRPGHDGARHHGRPHHMRPYSQHHHGGGHRHHGHHFAHAFSRGLVAVMIPTIAGVAVGMAVSLIGLLFGRLVAFLWIQLYRGGRRGRTSVALDENSAEGEKLLYAHSVELCADEEVLPVYEEAPAYTEVEKEQQ